jgi:hypothetical protein
MVSLLCVPSLAGGDAKLIASAQHVGSATASCDRTASAEDVLMPDALILAAPLAFMKSSLTQMNLMCSRAADAMLPTEEQ